MSEGNDILDVILGITLNSDGGSAKDLDDLINSLKELNAEIDKLESKNAQIPASTVINITGDGNPNTAGILEEGGDSETSEVEKAVEKVTKEAERGVDELKKKIGNGFASLSDQTKKTGEKGNKDSKAQIDGLKATVEDQIDNVDNTTKEEGKSSRDTTISESEYIRMQVDRNIKAVNAALLKILAFFPTIAFGKSATKVSMLSMASHYLGDERKILNELMPKKYDKAAFARNYGLKGADITEENIKKKFVGSVNTALQFMLGYINKGDIESAIGISRTIDRFKGGRLTNRSNDASIRDILNLKKLGLREHKLTALSLLGTLNEHAQFSNDEFSILLQPSAKRLAKGDVAVEAAKSMFTEKKSIFEILGGEKGKDAGKEIVMGMFGKSEEDVKKQLGELVKNIKEINDIEDLRHFKYSDKFQYPIEMIKAIFDKDDIGKIFADSRPDVIVKFSRAITDKIKNGVKTEDIVDYIANKIKEDGKFEMSQHGKDMMKTYIDEFRDDIKKSDTFSGIIMAKMAGNMNDIVEEITKSGNMLNKLLIDFAADITEFKNKEISTAYVPVGENALLKKFDITPEKLAAVGLEEQLKNIQEVLKSETIPEGFNDVIDKLTKEVTTLSGLIRDGNNTTKNDAANGVQDTFNNKQSG